MPLQLTDDAQKKLFDFLTPKDTSSFDVGGNGTQSVNNMPQNLTVNPKTPGFLDQFKAPDMSDEGLRKTADAAPEEPQEEVSPQTDQEKETEAKVQDSHPGLTNKDLGMADFIQGQEKQMSKYGPEEEQALYDQLIKERGSLPMTLARMGAAFTDTAAPAFGAGSGMSKSIEDEEAAKEKLKLDKLPTLQGMNEKQMAQKMTLEGMNPASPLAKTKAGAYQQVFRQLFPNMDAKTLSSLTANPSVAEKIFPEIGPIVEKQIQMQIQKEGLDINRQRLQAEEANNAAGRKIEAAKGKQALGKVGEFFHPDVAKAYDSAMGNNQTSSSTGPYGPTVQRNGSTYVWSSSTGKYHKQ